MKKSTASESPKHSTGQSENAQRDKHDRDRQGTAADRAASSGKTQKKPASQDRS